MTEGSSDAMSRARIAVVLDEKLLAVLDRLVRACVFASRSQAVQAALEEKLQRLQTARLARESAKLDPADEQALADEGLSADCERWPGY